jgi:hypothetical protein
MLIARSELALDVEGALAQVLGGWSVTPVWAHPQRHRGPSCSLSAGSEGCIENAADVCQLYLATTKKLQLVHG